MLSKLPSFAPMPDVCVANSKVKQVPAAEIVRDKATARKSVSNWPISEILFRAVATHLDRNESDGY